MIKNISVGIDIGSYQIKVVVAESVKENGKIARKIIGVGYTESRGLRHGYILNQEEVAKSLRHAISQAEKASGVKIKKALDVSQSEIAKTYSQNNKIIHPVPIQFKVDGKMIYGKPIGMKGARLEVKTLFISCLEHRVDDLVEALGEAGVEIEDIVAAPIAASLVTLSKAQKIAGCVLANIGSETVSIAVFENNIPISVEVFPLGGSDITNDIALGLKIPIEEAEALKRGTIVGITYPRKKLDEIITARLSDIFDLIEVHLKKIGRNGLLPAGIVITGGSSGIETIDDLAKAALRVPSRIANINFGEGNKGQIKDASWSVAFGLCVLGLSEEDQNLNGIKMAKKAKNDIVGWLKQFLP